jgi:hypothetical protein
MLSQFLSQVPAYRGRVSRQLQEMPGRTRWQSCACMALVIALIAGCGDGSTPAPTAAPISVVASSGATTQLNSLSVAATALLSMKPTSDSANAGVDWTATCGGNPVTGSVTGGACGTLAPMHTADGAATLFTAPSVIPIGAKITIRASVTSDPSQTSSVSLTIVRPAIVVALPALPASVLVNGKLTNLQAQVANDPTDAGVSWSAACGSSACGSFNPAVTVVTGNNATASTTYTAPATVPTGGTVTLTATSVTDPTRSASATVTVTPPSAVGSVSVSPASVYVETAGASRTTRFTATVTNDTSAAGVDWSVSCQASSCGTITNHTLSGSPATFVGPAAVPPGGTVTITATSTADPTKSTTAMATVLTTAPIVVTISSAVPATLTVGSQVKLTATVAPNTGSPAVNWTATCGGAACGTFSLSPAQTISGGSITYTAPASVPSGAVVTITASSASTTPSNPAIVMTTITAQPPSLAFAMTPPSALVGGAQAPVSAVVTNDVAPGGVTWTVQCGSSVAGGCGAIVPYQTTSSGIATYTAPPVTASGTSVTIHATSTADPKVSISSTPIAIAPSMTLSINFVPSAPSQVQADATVNLAAAVAAVGNDATNAGIDWQVCVSGCGFFTTQAAIPAIPATTTTPFVPAMPAVTSTKVTAWPNNLPLAYTAPSQPPTSGSVVVQVAAHASPATANSATIAITSAANGPGLHGVVQAGLQPVVGAAVGLYAAGTSGYASAASPVFAPGGTATVLTDKNGNFMVPAGYSCPQPNSQMYLVALGGQVGTHAPNPNLSLMTALGSCSSLSASSVVVNEVTSIASAWATAAFASNDALTGNSSFLYLGTSSTNIVGLVNAFAAVNNLVDINTGQARVTVPAGNAMVPYVEINTLADMLNACTGSAGGVQRDGSACGTLFTATNVLPASLGNFNGNIAPSDTLQAAFNIAQHPVSGYGYELDLFPQHLLGLTTLASPFQPILTTQPSDWSISLNYTGGGGLSSASEVGSFAEDAAGNLWITDTKAGSVIEWNGIGAALSPSTGFPAGGGPIAIDATGNVWISGNAVLSELTGIGTSAPGSPFGGVAGGGGDIAVDAQSNLWITNSGGVNEFNSLGLEISPSAGYTNEGITGISSVGVDSSDNVWVGNTTSTTLSVAELANPGGQLIVNSAPQSSPEQQVRPEMAADGVGDIWAVADGVNVYKVPPFLGKGSILTPTIYGNNAPPQTPSNIPFVNAEGIALDGAGGVWVGNQGGVTLIIPSLLASSGASGLSSESLAAGTLRVAVDGSGNIWVLLANNTVTEFVGAATPVVTPIALAVKNKKLGAKP